MIISLTRATERVESAPSSWAATPETCGAAMLVPLKVAVRGLLEPTYAARIPEPGACAHGGGDSIFGGAEDTGGRVASGMPLWREDMHAAVWRPGCGRDGGETLLKQAKGGRGTCTWTQAP